MRSPQALAKELVALQPDVILAHSTPISRRAAAGEPHDPDRVRQSSPTRSARASSRAWRGRAAISPACCSTRPASPASGWRCSRRSRRALRAPLSWPTPRRPPIELLPAGGRSRGAVARDRACTQSRRERRRHRACHRVPSRACRTAAWSCCPDARLCVHRDLIIALAARHRLPAVYALRSFVAAGGLMS